MDRSGRTVGTPAFDWVVLVLATVMIGGLMVVYWAAAHGQLENAVLTVWHVPLYLAVMALAYVVFAGIPGRGPDAATLPAGFESARLGVMLFVFGLLADFIWHGVAGPEEGPAQIVSPLHMVAFAGAALIVAGPLRAARVRLGREGAARTTALVGLPLGLLLVLAIAVFDLAAPLTDVRAAAVDDPQVLSQLYRTDADGTTLTRLRASDRESYQEPSIGSDGETMAFVAWTLPAGAIDWTGDIHVADGDGTTRNVTGDGAIQGGPRISPDGSRILFSRVSEAPAESAEPAGAGCPSEARLPQPGCPVTAIDRPAAGGWDVWTIGVDGSDLTQLTTDPGIDVVGDWSPDGTRIVFHSDRDGDGEIYLMSADGSDVRQLTDNDVEDWWPTFGGDGRIAFESYRDGETAEVYTMHADSGEITRWTTDEAEDFRPALSPDGGQVAFASDRDGNGWDLFVLDGPGMTPRNLTRTPTVDEFAAHWAPDDSIVFDGSPRSEPTGGDAEVIGATGILVLAAIIAGIVLVGLWVRPAFGAYTLAFTLGLAAIALTADQLRFVPAAVATGVLADVLVWRLRPSIRRPRQLIAVLGLVPAALTALYVGTVLVTDGSDWSTHLLLGVVAFAGLAGCAVAGVAIVSAGGSSEAPAAS